MHVPKILITLCVLAVLISGCASSPKFPNDVGKHASELSTEEESKLLKNGFPIYYGTKASAYTIQCIIVPGPQNQVTIYSGHNAPGLSRATQQVLQHLQADNECQALYGWVYDAQGNKIQQSPMTIINDVVAQEDMARKMLGALGVPLLNGVGLTVAQDVLGTVCGENCGPMFYNVNQPVANSASESGSASDTTVTIGTPCTDPDGC